jgi:hypothetical protein
MFPVGNTWTLVVATIYKSLPESRMVNKSQVSKQPQSKPDVCSSCRQKSLNAPVDAYRWRLSMPAQPASQPASVLVLSKLLTSSGDATCVRNKAVKVLSSNCHDKVSCAERLYL